MGDNKPKQNPKQNNTMKQKEIILALFKKFGMDAAKAQKAADDLFPTDEAAIPALDTDGVITAALEYARPLLKDQLAAELKPEFKGQYYAEAIGKIVAASGGLIKRADVSNMTLEEAAKLYATKVKEQVGGTTTEQQAMIDKLNAEIEKITADKAAEIESIRGEYTAKENARNVAGAFRDSLKKRTLNIDADTAAEGIMPIISANFTPVYDPESKGVVLMEKGDATKRAKKANGTAFVSFDEEVDSLINRFQWAAKSKGGGTDTGGMPGAAPKPPATNPNGPAKPSSPFGAALARAADAAGAE